MFIKISMLFVFFLSLILVGFYSRKHSTDVNGFVLGGRSVGPWLTAFAYGTSYFSAVIFVGYAGQFGWKYGIAATWIGIGNAILGSLLAWIVLGRRTRLMSHQLDSATMPEFFGKRYQSTSLKIGASVIVFIFLIPYTASLYNGLSRLFQTAFPGIDYSVCVIIMALLTAVYVILGGYMATAINDFIQGIIMLVGIVMVIYSVLSINGGFTGSLHKLATVTGDYPNIPGAYSSFFGPEPFNLFFVVILTSLGTWGLPQMVQKFYSIKSEKAINKGTVISTIFATVVAGGCYFLGGFGRLFDVDVASLGYDAIIPKMVSYLSPFLVGIVIVLVLAASMSTLSSLVLTSSSTLTLDFIKDNIIKNMSQKKQLFIIRVLIAFFIIISALIAIIQHKSSITFIAQLMGISWGTLAGAFLAPFLYGLYWKKTTKASVWVCFIVGVGVMVLNMLAPQIFPPILKSPINCGVTVMLLGLIIVPVVSIFTKPVNKESVDNMFECYVREIKVLSKNSLGEE